MFFRESSLRARLVPDPTHPDGFSLIDSRGNAMDLGALLAPIRWIRQLCPLMPHEYQLRQKVGRPAWVAMTALLREHPRAFDAYFRGYQTPNRYVDIGEWRYWRTQQGATHMLNRARHDWLLPGDHRRLDEGAMPIPWDTAPWAPLGSRLYDRDRRRPGIWWVRPDSGLMPCRSCSRGEPSR